MGSIQYSQSQCWVTLVTKPVYMPGVINLAHSLDLSESRYALVVLYTSSLGDSAIEVLQIESERSGRIKPRRVDLLSPRPGQENVGSVAERFADTFTKLRAFELFKYGYTKACYLDADMMALRTPDEIFDIDLPGRDWLGANHCCVCNLDKDAWAPKDWHKGNCAYTMITNPDQIADEVLRDLRPTYRRLNGGMFLFYPAETLWNSLITSFNASVKLKSYQFPDQDFLADFFKDKWRPLSWKFNALKTMRYVHPKMWSDEKVVMVHYIVDKPWSAGLDDFGIAGYLGRDGETHAWWYRTWKDWIKIYMKMPNYSNSPANVVLDWMGASPGPLELTPLPQKPGTPADALAYRPRD